MEDNEKPPKEEHPQEPDALDSLERAVEHGEAAVRAYADEISDAVSRRISRWFRKVVLGVVGIAILVVGLVMLVLGLADYLSDLTGVAGMGKIIVGAACIVVVIVLMVVMNRDKGLP